MAIGIASRSDDIQKFYYLLGRLEAKLGGTRLLATSSGKMEWPRRGVYFFLEAGEQRSTSGSEPRVVRVGTHALNAGSKSTLWKRLRQHRGTISGKYPGGGNRRISIFRDHVRLAIARRDSWSDELTSGWNPGYGDDQKLRLLEYPLECQVSGVIRAMPLLWLKVDDSPGSSSLRGLVERNTIGMLSNYPHAGIQEGEEYCIDQPSATWLGHHAESSEVAKSGLWNVNHVDEGYDPTFFDHFERLVSEM